MPEEKHILKVTVPAAEYNLFKEYALLLGRSVSNFALTSMRSEFKKHAPKDYKNRHDAIITSRLQ